MAISMVGSHDRVCVGVVWWGVGGGRWMIEIPRSHVAIVCGSHVAIRIELFDGF